MRLQGNFEIDHFASERVMGLETGHGVANATQNTLLATKVFTYKKPKCIRGSELIILHLSTMTSQVLYTAIFLVKRQGKF